MLFRSGKLSSTRRRNSAATTRLARGCPSAKATFLAEVQGPEEVRAAFFGLPLDEVDGQLADGLVLAFLFRRALPRFV